MEQSFGYEQAEGIKKPTYKKTILTVALVVVALLFYFFTRGQTEQVIGPEAKLYTYSKDGSAISGFVQVPFLKNADREYVLSVAIDQDNNGTLEQNEWLVKNHPTRALKDWYANIPFKQKIQLEGYKKVHVALHKPLAGEADFSKTEKLDYKIFEVVAQNQTLESVLGTENTKIPEESMKQGQGTGNTAIQNPTGVPDFSQQIAECAPTVAANGLYSLARKNGAGDKLPQNPQDMIAGLKQDMRWTPADGVVPANFVNGKNAWAVTHGLPIKTELIGERDGRGTLNAVKEALAKGAAVEMRIRFADANLKFVGGHIVSVVGVQETAGGETFIDIHDPASPSGTESYAVSANELKDYPFHPDGPTVLGIAFSQTWEGAPMGGNLDPMSEEEMRGIREFAGEKKTIKAIQVDNKYIPLSEVRVGKGDHCDGPETQFPHYHAAQGSSARATDGTNMPDNSGCGYGKVKDTPVVDVQVP